MHARGPSHRQWTHHHSSSMCLLLLCTLNFFANKNKVKIAEKIKVVYKRQIIYLPSVKLDFHFRHICFDLNYSKITFSSPLGLFCIHYCLLFSNSFKYTKHGKTNFNCSAL